VSTYGDIKKERKKKKKKKKKSGVKSMRDQHRRGSAVFVNKAFEKYLVSIRLKF